ncbi:hypothetical protein MMC30_003222 [Trapelia coarctata]|nr:hypothetical protein [Trapelia coarctata]
MACIETKPPDIIIYYCHGGGFSMGSTYFYLEPLLALLTLLKPHYQNPAIFALEYTLVPEASYPTQLSQTMAGYDHALSLVHNDASRICVAGDSAGATLILSLLLHLAQEPGGQTRRPGYATLISPWVTLASDNNRDTPSDYLSKESLQLYGSQYAATKENLSDPLVSPGCCVYLDWWTRAAPRNGMYIAFGSEEVLGLETRNLISRLEKSGVNISVREYASGIHAWAIASLFLEETIEERIRGMKELAKMVAWNIPHSLIKARAYH